MNSRFSGWAARSFVKASAISHHSLQLGEAQLRASAEPIMLDLAAMPFPVPHYTRSRVDAAGVELVDESVSGSRREVALDIINNWRSAHNYPLLATRITLQSRSRRLDSKSLVAQRLKKLASIDTKLRRNPNMKLSQMQDIGGCRSVLSTVDRVDQLTEVYRKNPLRSTRARPPYDYITHPKNDGYRSYHLVYKYQSSSETHSVYNGQRIEIQIRSKLQHAWATTVEVVDTITGRAIKAGGGDAEWRRFFALISSAMATAEKRPTVPSTPSERNILHREIKELAEHLNVEKRLRAYVVSVRVDEVVPGQTFLLNLNLESQEVFVQGFLSAAEASAAYLAVEKENALLPHMNAVLVTLDDLKNLRSAYPNYYLDTSEFLKFLAGITERRRGAVAAG